MSLISKLIVFFLLTINQASFVLAQENKSREVQVAASMQQYFLPEDNDLTIPVFSLYQADLMLEARFNYESLGSGSFWLGHVFSFGEEWEFELTPMAGFVYGSSHGAAPGFKADVTYGKLNFYSEIEYVFNFKGREDNFFYSWSELVYEAFERTSIGIVGNRTRVYDSDVELDRGPIIRFTVEPVSIYFTALNLDDDAICILGIETDIL